MSTSISNLLVYGFIRQISPLLNHELIPIEIYELCHLFYMIPFQLFCIKVTNLDDIEETQFGIIDIANKQLSTIILLNTFKDNEMNTMYYESLCSIPNVSNLLSNDISKSSLSLNGIFGCYDNNCDLYGYNYPVPSYPFLILYEEKNETNIVAKYEYKSLISIQNHPTQCLVCDDMIINEFDGKLYSLNLKNVRKSNDLSNFTEIIQTKQKYQFHFHDADSRYYLNMTSLPYNKSIFCVECYNYNFAERDCEDDALYAGTVTCGIFSMETNYWTDIVSYKYHKVCQSIKFECVTHYNDKSIFMVTNVLDTVKYDFHKNKWILLDNNSIYFPERKSNVLWMDDTNRDILYHMSQRGLQYFDLRDNNSAWSEACQIEGALQTRQIDVKYFC